MVKEIIKKTDGTEQEITITFLGGRKSAALQKKYLPLDQIQQTKEGVKLGSGVDMSGLMLESLQTIEGFDVDKTMGDECGRIFHEYHFPEILGSLGVGNPNLKES